MDLKFKEKDQDVNVICDEPCNEPKSTTSNKDPETDLSEKQVVNPTKTDGPANESSMLSVVSDVGTVFEETAIGEDVDHFPVVGKELTFTFPASGLKGLLIIRQRQISLMIPTFQFLHQHFLRRAKPRYSLCLMESTSAAACFVPPIPICTQTLVTTVNDSGVWVFQSWKSGFQRGICLRN
jgi:hypothetical protein